MGKLRVTSISTARNRPALRSAVAVTPTLLLIALASGCTAGNTDDANSLENMTPTINYEDGSLETPSDQLTLTWDEETTIGYALSIATSQCAGARGVTYSPYDRRDELSEKAYTEAGVWSPVLAARFGYETIPDTEAKESVIGEQLSEEDVEVLRDCAMNDSSVKLFADIEDDYANRIVPGIVDNTVVNDEARESIRQTWVDCMGDEGISIDDDSFIPTGVGSMSEEASIEMALKDVDCKESTGFMEAWATNLWDEQKEYVIQHASEYQEFRSRAEPALEEARHVITNYEG